MNDKPKSVQLHDALLAFKDAGGTYEFALVMLQALFAQPVQPPAGPASLEKDVR